jgi:CRP-like cAMP-binding protein
MENHLLNGLPSDVQAGLFPHLTRIPMHLGEVLYESDEPIAWTYFPIDCIVSLLYVMGDGHSAEISVVGHEGMAGIAAFTGGNSMPSRAIIQSAGDTYRMPAEEFRKVCNQPDGTMRTLMLRYTQALITQMAQTAVCNRHHTIGQQLCRWILLSLDRLPSNKLNMTQELIANMLGVRREGVTEAAGKLQKLGIIEYHRGHITVLDRARLEEMSCECYEVVRSEAERLLPYYPSTTDMERVGGVTYRVQRPHAPHPRHIN